MASAMERDLDIESLVAPKAMSNDRQTVVPLVGFSSLGDSRQPELPLEVPGPLKGQLSEREWLADVKIVIDAGLREHWNLSSCICCLCMNQIPALAPISGLAVIVLLIIVAMTAHSFFHAITGLIGGLVIVVGFIVMYICIEHVKNNDIERRCTELSKTPFFMEKNLSFGFFATREKRLMKPLKYLVVYHEALVLDGRERVASVHSSQLRLNVLQRQYSRSVAGQRASMDAGNLVKPPQSSSPLLRVPITQKLPTPMEKYHHQPQQQQQQRVNSIHNPNPLIDHSLGVRQAPKNTLDPTTTSGQPVVRLPPRQTLDQIQEPSTSNLDSNDTMEEEEREEEEGLTMRTVVVNPLRPAAEEETLPQEVVTRPPPPPPT